MYHLGFQFETHLTTAYFSIKSKLYCDLQHVLYLLCTTSPLLCFSHTGLLN